MLRIIQLNILVIYDVHILVIVIIKTVIVNATTEIFVKFMINIFDDSVFKICKNLTIFLSAIMSQPYYKFLRKSLIYLLVFYKSKTYKK